MGRLAGQLAAFYARHNPAKLGSEAGLARDSLGREDELNRLLREKYGQDLPSLQAAVHLTPPPLGETGRESGVGGRGHVSSKLVYRALRHVSGSPSAHDPTVVWWSNGRFTGQTTACRMNGQNWIRPSPGQLLRLETAQPRLCNVLIA